MNGKRKYTYTHTCIRTYKLMHEKRISFSIIQLYLDQQTSVLNFCLHTDTNDINIVHVHKPL